MNGQKNVKQCDTRQATQIHRYKNTKLKLHRNNTAVRFNKTFKANQLTANDGNLKIKSDNPRSEKTKTPAIRY
jgi:hypothetical protein